MLEKFAKKDKKNLFDAHFHYAVCKRLGLSLPYFGDDIKWSGISCAHSKAEYLIQGTAPENIIQAFGMHPQNAADEDIIESSDFLESLLENQKIEFIGETGFDYFTPEFCEAKKQQEEIWNIQLALALKYNIPLVIHCRKANNKLFEYSNQLKKLPEVLFHSFMGSPTEAKSLLNRDINAYFSFGKQMMNGNKKVIECVRQLPEERLLTETDAPFQTLKGEEYTDLSDIKKIYEIMIALRKKNKS